MRHPATRHPHRSTNRTPIPLLLSVVLVRVHRPEPLVVAGCVVAIGLRRIAVDQRPQVHRVCGAAHLVFDREQVLAISKIDDVAEAVLILVVFAKDQVALRQPAVRTGEVRDVHLDMVAVVIRLRPIGLAELQMLVLAHLHTRYGTIAVLELGGHPHDLWIERANALCGPDRYIELDIGNAECNTPKARGVRLVAAHAIAPWTSRLDMVVMLAERECGTVEFFGDRREPVEQSLTARDDDPGMAPQYLRVATRQMKLAPANIDPHIGVRHHQVWVAGKAEPGDIKQCGQALVGHLYIDVFEVDRVAKIFGGAIELLMHGRGPGSGWRTHYNA